MYGSAGLAGSVLVPSASVGALRRGQQRQVGPQHHDLGLRPWAAMPDRAGRDSGRAGWVSAKNESRRSGPGGGKMSTSPMVEQGPDLVLGPAHRRRRRDDLGRIVWPSTVWQHKRVDRRLVEADHRPQRTGDQVQLVLDDQVRRQQAATGSGRPLRGWHGP